MLPSREILRNRHRLSHQQIDELLDEQMAVNFMNEKLEQMELVRELLLLSDALEKAGVGFIPLKGPVLSHRLYGDASVRVSRDLDFLVKLEDMGKVLETFYRQGYVNSEHAWPEEKSKQQLFIRHRHHFNLWHPEKDCYAELHWKLFYFRFKEEKKIRQMVEGNRVDYAFSGRTFTMLNNEMELLYLVIHGGLHDWKRLKWLADVDKMLRTCAFDWQKFSVLATELNAERQVALCNALLRLYFPASADLLPKCNAPIKGLLRFALRQINDEKGVEYDTAAGFVRFYGMKLIAFPGFGYKISVIKQLFFMPEDMDRDNVLGSKWMLYLIGPFNKLKRRLQWRKEEN